MITAKRIITKVLDKSGVGINGSAPWDITVHDDRFYSRVLQQGSLGLVNPIWDGWWNCPHIDQLVERALSERDAVDCGAESVRSLAVR